MKRQRISETIGNINPKFIVEATEYQGKEKVIFQRIWHKRIAIAACLCLVVGIMLRVAIGFIPSQMTDTFREGNLIEITNESELPTRYTGKLLAFNLEFEKYEFYYKYNGIAENTGDWYSLLAAKADTKGDILLHCMFGDTTVEDWKVSGVFTSNATQKFNVNGVEVQIAAHPVPSLKYKYWHYAIFEYDNVVYDIRVQSDNAEYVYEVLDTLIGTD